jgi:hypothetical protein
LGRSYSAGGCFIALFGYGCVGCCDWIVVGLNLGEAINERFNFFKMFRARWIYVSFVSETDRERR